VLTSPWLKKIILPTLLLLFHTKILLVMNGLTLWIQLTERKSLFRIAGCDEDSPGITAKQLKAKRKKMAKECNQQPPPSPSRRSKHKQGEHPSFP
jgi:hypothetical protein